MNKHRKSMFRGCAHPFTAVARLYRSKVKPALHSFSSQTWHDAGRILSLCVWPIAWVLSRAWALVTFTWCVVTWPFVAFYKLLVVLWHHLIMPCLTGVWLAITDIWWLITWPVFFGWRLLKRVAVFLWPYTQPQLRRAVRCAVFIGRQWWRFRRPQLALAIIVAFAAVGYEGYQLVPLQSPQQIWYNKGVLEIRKDIRGNHPWTSFQHPDMDMLEKSLWYYKEQCEAGILDRLLYGRPNVEMAAQAYLKMGTIFLAANPGDEVNVKMARDMLEQAVALNPGIPYARELLLDPTRIDQLAIEALAAERNLERMFEEHPQQRAQKPDKSKKDGNGDQSQDQGSQNGEPDQPNDQPAEGDNKQEKGKEAPSSRNSTLQQNQQDVKGGTANDGI